MGKITRKRGADDALGELAHGIGPFSTKLEVKKWLDEILPDSDTVKGFATGKALLRCASSQVRFKEEVLPLLPAAPRVCTRHAFRSDSESSLIPLVAHACLPVYVFRRSCATADRRSLRCQQQQEEG